jgi:uncharacterized protein YcfJ
MIIRSSIVSRAVLVAMGVVGVATSALADPPRWAHAYGHRDHDDRYSRYDRDSDYARVIDVDPIIRRVRVSAPQRECWNEDRPVAAGPSHTEIRSTIIGGLIGAAVGHHISAAQRIHDPVAVIGSSLIGAAIGNNIGVHKAERRGEYREVGYESVQRCEVNYRDDWEEQIDGYRVTYVYHGREYTTRMPYDPGERVRVNVDVEPDFDGR